MSQHLDALAKGNALRVEAAELRRAVRTASSRDGAERAAAILLYDESDAAGALWLDELLRCVHRFGPARTDTLIRSFGIRGRRRLRELTPRQRGVLADRLAEAAEYPAARRTA